VRDLPRPLQGYLWLLFLASIVLVIGPVGFWFWSPGHSIGQLPLVVLLFGLLAYLGEHTVVRVSRSISLTLATTVHIATILLFPLPLPILVTLLAALASGLHDTHFPLYKRAFNVAHEVLTVGICSLAFALIAAPSHVLRLDHIEAILPHLVVLLVLYYALDVGLVIGVLSLLERRSPWELWLDTNRRTLLPELAASSIGILAATTWSVSPLLLALFVVPVVALHVTFRAIAQAEERAAALQHVVTAAQRMQHLHQAPTDLLHEVLTAALAITNATIGRAYTRDPDDPSRLERVALVPSSADSGSTYLPIPPTQQGVVIDGAAHVVTMSIEWNTTGVLGLVLLSGVPTEVGRAAQDALTILASQAAGAWRNVLMHEQVEALASEDGLTSLLNHRSFHRRLEEEDARLRRGTQQQLALAMVDLDDFGQINNTYGHQGGDAALSAVATILRESGRASDVAARYGGDEFALILPATEMDEALAVAERVRGAITGLRIVHEGATIRLNASIGVAVLPLHATTPAGLIRAADQAVYMAKHAGKGHVGRPEDALLAQGHDIAALAAQLEHATRPSVTEAVTSRNLASDGEPPHDAVVLCLRLANREAGVDLQRFPAGVPGIGLDQRVVDALLLEPRQ